MALHQLTPPAPLYTRGEQQPVQQSGDHVSGIVDTYPRTSTRREAPRLKP